MTHIRSTLIPVLLLLASASAGAQQWGGSPVAARGRHESSAESKPATPANPNGYPSQWGGSPPQHRSHENCGAEFVIPGNAFIPFAVEAPAPVAATVVVDTVFTQVVLPPVQMQVITSPHEERQLTTMEVYRRERFRNP